MHIEEIIRHIEECFDTSGLITKDCDPRDLYQCYLECYRKETEGDGDNSEWLTEGDFYLYISYLQDEFEEEKN